jgi:predicted SnoaL-like aldol condensation-catalyzing enzyme
MNRVLQVLAACAGMLSIPGAWAAEQVVTLPATQQAEMLHQQDHVLARNKRAAFEDWRRQRDGGGLITIVADGDAVVLALLDKRQDPHDPDLHFEAVRFEYYRFADGKQIEHRSTPQFSLAQIRAALRQPVPSEPPPPGEPSAGTVPLEQQATRLLGNPNAGVATNKRVAFDFFRIALVSGHLDATPQYATPSYLQHNPTIPSGRDALVAALSKFIKPAPTISPGIPGLVRVLGERDMVILVQERVSGGADTWMFDMFRVSDGKVAEHWDSPREAAEVGAVRNSDPTNLLPAAPAAAARDAHQALQGVWLIEHPVSIAKTTAGEAPPLRPEALSVYQQRVAARSAGDTTFDGTTWCASAGIPRLMLTNHPFQIVLQSNSTALFYYEWNRWARLVYMTDKQLEPVGDNSMGVATGSWEGDTLVIDSRGFRPNTLLDDSGLPHSDQLHVIERLRLTDRDELEDRMTIDDPDSYQRSWEMHLTYRRRQHEELKEDVCLDRAVLGETAGLLKR